MEATPKRPVMQGLTTPTPAPSPQQTAQPAPPMRSAVPALHPVSCVLQATAAAARAAHLPAAARSTASWGKHHAQRAPAAASVQQLTKLPR